MTRPTSVLLVDDQPVARIGLRAVLEGGGRFSVVGEADSVSRAAMRAVEVQPELVIVALRLPDGSGVDAIRAVQSAVPGARCVLFSPEQDDEAVMEAFAVGASGFLLKTLEPDLIVEWLEVVAAGGFALGPVMTERLLVRYRDAKTWTGS